MNAIGGYFELELRKGQEFHKGAIRLNSGRNAFDYILRAKGYKKVYIPYYTCDAMLEPIIKLNLDYELYNINEQLEPIFNFKKIVKDEAFVYTNYFGIKGNFIKTIADVCTNLIVDNCQAFFELPIEGIDTFYSPRKFFGIPDGAYLYTNKLLEIELSYDDSNSRFSHLIKRIGEGAQSGYSDYKANEDNIKGQSIKFMSLLTQALLCNIDYNSVLCTRIENFKFLNDSFRKSNQLKLPETIDFVPMIFPYLVSDGKYLKQRLLKKNIYVATYWPNVFNALGEENFEYYLTEHNLCLPIDQRYGINDMKKIIKTLT